MKVLTIIWEEERIVRNYDLDEREKERERERERERVCVFTLCIFTHIKKKAIFGQSRCLIIFFCEFYNFQFN